MKYGLHNALTCYPLKGWQKLFKWFIQPFSQCQSVISYNQAQYDVQVALYNGEWYGSHGIAWYDIKLFDFLDKLDGKEIYIRLGYDNHFFKKKENNKFIDLVSYINNNYPNVTVYEYYIENSKGLDIFNYNNISIFERYWTLSWAKEQVKNKWWKFYLLIPLPKLWNKKYKEQWLQEFQESGKEIFMTDFV